MINEDVDGAEFYAGPFARTALYADPIRFAETVVDWCQTDDQRWRVTAWLRAVAAEVEP